MADVDYQQLEKRLGRQLLAQRLKIQTHHVARLFGNGKVWFHIEHIRTLHRIIRNTLKAVGLYWRGHRNALAVRVNFQELPCPDLPEEFDGYRLLHISDTHIDGNPELIDILIRLVKPLEYDTCIITGDFREGTFEDYEMPTRRMVELRRHIKTGVFAILGNHDAIEMVPMLEDGGIRVLLNEHAALERGGATIWLAGVDDPHYYETDNLDKALEGVPENGFKILLAHSPEIARKAAFAGINLYLCGHTHAGQICLPGGLPLLTNSKCPHKLHSGLWRFEEMTGYTSRGAGTSSVAVRFNCPPEITVHTLRRKSP
ncbi:MAG: metallophosphoesterase [Kiritimatiellaceae bacterium]|nr:metallophosphoesterase [Kiritimatiellaceae bacterium]